MYHGTGTTTINMTINYFDNYYVIIYLFLIYSIAVP